MDRSWEELVGLGEKFRVVGSEEMRRVNFKDTKLNFAKESLNYNCHFNLTEPAYMLLEVIARSKRNGIAQISLGKVLPEKTGVDARGVGLSVSIVYFLVQPLFH